MKDGRLQHEIGARVRIKGITDPYDVDLNGREGVLSRPFHKFPIKEIGIRLDAIPCTPQSCKTIDRDYVVHECCERSVGVYRNEFEVVGY